jgi:hypothetical protein
LREPRCEPIALSSSGLQRIQLAAHLGVVMEQAIQLPTQLLRLSMLCIPVCSERGNVCLQAVGPAGGGGELGLKLLQGSSSSNSSKTSSRDETQYQKASCAAELGRHNANMKAQRFNGSAGGALADAREKPT